MIRAALKDSGFILTDNMLTQFEQYAALLVEWNQKMNLTAITELGQIAVKHFLDSLLTLKAFPLPKNARVIDVGTGAGFPGIPIKIAKPDIHLTLLDSLQKRLTFLDELTKTIGVKAEFVHSRAEDAANLEVFREVFDVVVSRAVAPLNVLLEYCLPFVKEGGVFVALKGSKAQEEIMEARNALKVLNGEVFKVDNFNLEGEERNIVVIKKVSKLDAAYPRCSAKIKRKPL